MHELQRVLERQVRELASGVLSQPECSALDRSAEADVSVGLGGHKNVCSHDVVRGRRTGIDESGRRRVRRVSCEGSRVQPLRDAQHKGVFVCIVRNSGSQHSGLLLPWARSSPARLWRGPLQRSSRAGLRREPDRHLRRRRRQHRRDATVNSEVEPFLAVDPSNPNVMIGAWQQDRWSNGGSEGLVTATSTNGGASWTVNAQTKSTKCTGGTAANGGNYERASDPWVAISPNGTAYLMSLSVDTNPGGF